MSNVDRAAQMFRDGFACSQAILGVYGTRHGLLREQAIRIAAGFAGGMRMAGTCGAVTGAIMVLGLRYASADSRALGRSEVYARVLEFADRFSERNGSLCCRELLGCDISTPEGMDHAREHDLFGTTCVQMVEDAANILEAMMQAHSGKDEG